MQIVCLRALINSDPCLWKTWKNRLRLDCDLGHVGEGSERTMHLRSRKAAEKHQHQQRQQQAPPPTPTPPCSGFWPHLLCLTVASCPRAWARDPAPRQTPAPQPPPHPRRRKPHPRGSRTSHGVATHTHLTPQGRHWRQPSSKDAPPTPGNEAAVAAPPPPPGQVPVGGA